MDLVFSDEYIEAIKENVVKDMEDVQKALNTYLACMNKLKAKGLMEGKRADDMEDFSAKLKGMLNDQFVHKGNAVKSYLGEFVRDIDDADKDLY